MNDTHQLLKSGNRLANNPRRFWQRSSEDIRAAAILIAQDKLLITTPKLGIDSDIGSAEPLPADIALKLLSTRQGWMEQEPEVADQTVKRIRTILKRYPDYPQGIAADKIIGAFEIADKYVANRVINHLHRIQERYDKRSPLERGLLKALARWSKRNVYGLITPQALVKLKNDLGYTQAQMALALKVTQRQYARYESGEAAVLEKRKAALGRLYTKAKQSKSTSSPATAPRRSTRRNSIPEYVQATSHKAK